MRNDIYKKYYNFLLHLADVGRNYSSLMAHLHKIEFYDLVPNDSNRAGDGTRLREIFLDKCENESNMDIVFEMGNCTVLELLIGISYRMEHELYGHRESMDAHECFWTLIKHLNLDWVDNIAYEEEGGAGAIDKAVKKFLSRKYSKNGNGGLFPLRKTTKDQRTVEIWFQMHEWLMENYSWW